MMGPTHDEKFSWISNNIPSPRLTAHVTLKAKCHGKGSGIGSLVGIEDGLLRSTKQISQSDGASESRRKV